jgi:4-hydroxy-tetrahydrodipicolinate reductase
MSVKVMVNGLPGNMAKEVIIAAKNRGCEIVPFSLTGPGITDKTVIVDGIEIELVLPDNRDKKLAEIKAQFHSFITVDYTHPTAVNDNGKFYAEQGLAFVMGTTGGDREQLSKDVDTAELYAVIAPNMAKQIVALQAQLEATRDRFPRLYKGYTLTVIESHQKTKADTSGTAKAIVEIFNDMGIELFEVDEIEKVRVESEMGNKMDVPDEYLSGHAFHTYRLTSPDGTVAFEYRHNVCGRSIYAEGTVDAVKFLDRQITEESIQKRFNMIDVLQAGAMK